MRTSLLLFTCIGLKAASHNFLVLNLYLLEVRQYLYDERPHQSFLPQAQLTQNVLQYYQCHTARATVSVVLWRFNLILIKVLHLLIVACTRCDKVRNCKLEVKKHIRNNT